MWEVAYIIRYNLCNYMDIAVSNAIFANVAGRSDWDDGRWEWEESPRRDNYPNTSRRHQPSPAPMLLGASPDARLVSPWLGGHTPGMIFKHQPYWKRTNLDLFFHYDRDGWFSFYLLF